MAETTNKELFEALPVPRAVGAMALPDRRSIGSIFNVGVPSAISTLLFDIDHVVIDKLLMAA